MREFWEDNRREILILVIVLALIFFIYLANQGDKPPQYKIIDAGGPIPEGWHPGLMTNELYEVLSGVDTIESKTAAYARFNALNDNQIIAVYNQWTKDYYDKRTWYGTRYGTLTDMWDSEVLEFGPEYTKGLMRLQRLGLP